MSLTQCHDKFDQNDVVLREQISKVLFIVLPQVATVLIKVCQEDCLRGPSLVHTALKCLGRFLCLVLQDYEKKPSNIISNEQFLKLFNPVTDSKVPQKISKQNIDKVEKSSDWLATASTNLSKILINLKSLRGSEHSKIRHELAVLSFNLLSKCLPNCKLFMRFLLENLIQFCDDSQEQLQSFSINSLKELTKSIPNINQEISEMFSLHLTSMPRIIMTGLESEQHAGMALLNSYIKILSNDLHMEPIFENHVLLEKFINVLTSCCTVDAPKELIFYEITSTDILSDEFYKMDKPWKNFKNLKNKAVVEKFRDIFKTIGKSRFLQIFVNFILDNVTSVEFLVLLNEILECDTVKLDTEQLYSIGDEYLNENYWNLPTKAVSQFSKTSNVREEWFQESTPGLYESAVEVRLRDINFEEDEDEKQYREIQNLKSIKYNILCTCTLLELIGKIANQLGDKFKRFNLRCLHLILEKTGNSNFLIKNAGLYALRCISKAMNHDDISQLIDSNSDYLLFNINKLLKHNSENEAILDMMSVVFKYSKTSIAAYVEDIVEATSNQIINQKYSKNSPSYLKLFNLYVNSVRQSNVENEKDIDVDIKTDWNEFLEQCIYELENSDDEMNPNESPNDPPEVESEQNQEVPEGIEQEQNEPEEELPQNIQLLIKILNATYPFFASSNSTEVILAHEIFLNGIPVLHVYEKQFLPMVHQMWYPFTKQVQGKDFVVLQYSVKLLSTIGKFAKDFVYKKSMDNVIPVVNKFLKSSHPHTNKHKNLTFTQEFKLQREILSDYGHLAVNLGIKEKELDEILDILVMYFKNHSNVQLQNAAKQSLDVISQTDPLLIKFKLNF